MKKLYRINISPGTILVAAENEGEAWELANEHVSTYLNDDNLMELDTTPYLPETEEHIEEILDNLPDGWNPYDFPYGSDDNIQHILYNTLEYNFSETDKEQEKALIESEILDELRNIRNKIEDLIFELEDK